MKRRAGGDGRGRADGEQRTTSDYSTSAFLGSLLLMQVIW